MCQIFLSFFFFPLLSGNWTVLAPVMGEGGYPNSEEVKLSSAVNQTQGEGFSLQAKHCKWFKTESLTAHEGPLLFRFPKPLCNHILIINPWIR